MANNAFRNAVSHIVSCAFETGLIQPQHATQLFGVFIAKARDFYIDPLLAAIGDLPLAPESRPQRAGQPNIFALRYSFHCRPAWLFHFFATQK